MPFVLQEVRSQMFKIRASEARALMSKGRNKSDEWGETSLKILKRYIYGKKSSPFTSKYTDKGIECEEASIELVASIEGWGDVLKNEEHRENEWFTGTPDVVLVDMVADIKNSYSQDTFPLFNDTIPSDEYYDQLQVYMDLFDKEQALLCYTLMDAPESVIEREYSSRYGWGGEIDLELYEELRVEMTYSHLPIPLRYKSYLVYRDRERIKQLLDRVEQGRVFIEIIKNKIKTN